MSTVQPTPLTPPLAAGTAPSEPGLEAHAGAEPKAGALHPAADVRQAIRIGTALIVLIFGGLGVWAAVAPLAGAVIAVGVIKVDTNRKTVQHLEGGIVKQILVRDGDHVVVGQPLIEIEDERVAATVEVLQGQLDAETAKAARLAAERDEQDRIEFPATLAARTDDPNVAQLMRTETTFFETKRGALQTQIHLLEQKMREARQEIESLNARAEAEEAAAALLAEEITANETLEGSHYVNKVHVLTLKRGMEDYRARRGEHLADMARARQNISEMELRIITLKDDYVEYAAQELTASNAKIFDLQERLRPSLDAKRRLQIVAPITGTVVDVKVFTVGGVVAPREALMDIVPDDNPLIVEAQIPVDSIDDVYVGQAADVSLSAYTARNTPLVAGTVTYVSADKLDDRETRLPYYRVRVVVDKQSLADAGNLTLTPGMPAAVYITTGERTALQYLLSPVTDSMRRSFREP